MKVESETCEQLPDNLSIRKAYCHLLFDVNHVYCPNSNLANLNHWLPLRVEIRFFFPKISKHPWLVLHGLTLEYVLIQCLLD